MDIFQTLNFIEGAHAGQTDKLGIPYVNHLHVVYESLRLSFENVPVYALQAALLHDVIEDTGVTYELLHRLQYSHETIGLVRWLTKSEHSTVTYLDYVRDICAEGPTWAVAIKWCDVNHNLDPNRMNMFPTRGKETDLNSLKQRYIKARDILEDELWNRINWIP